MRKGQAAMEFLSTYGWAMLIIIGVIGAMAYYGSFKTDSLVPDTCYMEPTAQIGCDEFSLQEGNLKLRLLNKAGTNIDINEVTCENEEGTNTGKADFDIEDYGNITAGTTKDFDCKLDDAPEGKSKILFKIKYKESENMYFTTVDGYTVATPVN